MKRSQFRSDAKKAVEVGQALALEGPQLRRALRRNARKSSPQRRGQLEQMIARINEAQIPIRSLMGAIQFSDLKDDDDRALRDVSRALQQERRRLRKMLPTSRVA